MQFGAHIAGLAGLFIVWGAYRVLAGHWDLGKLVEGADGRPSSSKLQFFLWTAAVFFSYGALLGARFLSGQFAPIDQIPPNLLLVMGFSTATMTIAKGITSANVASGKEEKPPLDGGAKGASAVVLDDSGFPALNKIQMLAWTFIAIIVYLLAVERDLAQAAAGTKALATLALPDIDGALMALMGVGDAAYLGKKLTTSAPTSRITGVSPASVSASAPEPDKQVTLFGMAFGEQQKGSLVTFDGQPQEVKAAWADHELRFPFPGLRPDGSGWQKGQRVEIGVIVEGRPGANTIPITVL